ncbi:hypothetical protein DMN91_003314 [Ooceraea biroi]|uniref:Uncharacterized protein n=1 Tax=Ooceraea biroi TaxID=2015173 RepID=A0A3L8DXP6_OOCBI|nr:hypothetical protein DMN91_003314 [Ooceraea biroi]
MLSDGLELAVTRVAPQVSLPLDNSDCNNRNGVIISCVKEFRGHSPPIEPRRVIRHFFELLRRTFAANDRNGLVVLTTSSTFEDYETRVSPTHGAWSHIRTLR